MKVKKTLEYNFDAVFGVFYREHIGLVKYPKNRIKIIF